MLKNVGGWTTDRWTMDTWLDYKLTSERKGSGEFKTRTASGLLGGKDYGHNLFICPSVMIKNTDTIHTVF